MLEGALRELGYGRSREAVRRQLVINLNVNRMDDVRVSECALHELETTIPLFADPRHPDDPVATSYAAHGRTAPLGEVRAAPLDLLVSEHGLDRVDIIKLDLEGSELFALRGARRTIERFRPELILELSDPLFAAAGYTRDELLDFLEAYDYRYGPISDYHLAETLRHPSRGRYGKVSSVPRAQLPAHGNIYAARAEIFREVSDG